MKNKIAFLGDSLTHGGRWEEFFPNHEIKNFGIPGEKSGEILSRLDQVIDWQPHKIFLMMGVNDLGDGLDPETVLEHHESIITRVKGQQAAELTVQSLLPINQDLYKSPNFGNREILETNRLLRELCERENVFFLDLQKSFATYSNELVREYTYDGVHLTEAGYRVWKNCLSPLIVPI